jgi:Pyridoxamine 5'-phosphate oxidase like
MPIRRCLLRSDLTVGWIRGRWAACSANSTTRSGSSPSAILQRRKKLVADDRVLVSYANPAEYEYVSISGRGRIVDDRAKVHDLWSEGLRVWFPNGPDDPELALLSIDVEEARYWTNAASVATYAWLYVKARVAGKPAAADEVVETKSVRF